MNREALAFNSYFKHASMRLKTVLTPITLNATFNKYPEITLKK
jgi:hypothetical protein